MWHTLFVHWISQLVKTECFLRLITKMINVETQSEVQERPEVFMPIEIFISTVVSSRDNTMRIQGLDRFVCYCDRFLTVPWNYAFDHRIMGFDQTINQSHMRHARGQRETNGWLPVMPVEETTWAFLVRFDRFFSCFAEERVLTTCSDTCDHYNRTTMCVLCHIARRCLKLGGLRASRFLFLLLMK